MSYSPLHQVHEVFHLHHCLHFCLGMFAASRFPPHSDGHVPFDKVSFALDAFKEIISYFPL